MKGVIFKAVAEEKAKNKKIHQKIINRIDTLFERIEGETAAFQVLNDVNI